MIKKIIYSLIALSIFLGSLSLFFIVSNKAIVDAQSIELPNTCTYPENKSNVDFSKFDYNTDCKVNGADLSIFLNAYNVYQTLPSTTPTSTVTSTPTTTTPTTTVPTGTITITTDPCSGTTICEPTPTVN